MSSSNKQHFIFCINILPGRIKYLRSQNKLNSYQKTRRVVFCGGFIYFNALKAGWGLRQNNRAKSSLEYTNEKIALITTRTRARVHTFSSIDFTQVELLRDSYKSA